MIEYSSRWLPYGGPRPEDTFVEFGLTPRQFAHRVFESLDRDPMLELTEGQKRELRDNLVSILDSSYRLQGVAEETINSKINVRRRDRPGLGPWQDPEISARAWNAQQIPVVS